LVGYIVPKIAYVHNARHHLFILGTWEHPKTRSPVKLEAEGGKKPIKRHYNAYFTGVF